MMFLLIAMDKVALLIGNKNYQAHLLNCPHNDAAKGNDWKLHEFNLETISLADLTLDQMSKAVDYHCSLLSKGMYAVFYFSGHGIADS